MRGLVRGLSKQLAHFILYVDPARRQAVHLDHGIAVILETPRL